MENLPHFSEIMEQYQGLHEMLKEHYFAKPAEEKGALPFPRYFDFEAAFDHKVQITLCKILSAIGANNTKNYACLAAMSANSADLMKDMGQLLWCSGYDNYLSWAALGRLTTDANKALLNEIENKLNEETAKLFLALKEIGFGEDITTYQNFLHRLTAHFITQCGKDSETDFTAAIQVVDEDLINPLLS